VIKLSLEIVIGIIGLIFTGITSIAGIKYILSSWKIRKLAKQFKKKQVDRDYLQKIAMDADYKNTAKNILGGEPLFLMSKTVEDLKEEMEFQLDRINRTLKRFSNYKEPEIPKDFFSKIGEEKENNNKD